MKDMDECDEQESLHGRSIMAFQYLLRSHPRLGAW